MLNSIPTTFTVLLLVEPAKPMYLALVRTAASTSTDKINITNEDGSLIVNNTLRAYPNPFGAVINIDFELKEAVNVVTSIVTIDGKPVYSNAAGVLPAGSYTLPIQTQQIAAGYYILKLQYGNKVRTAKVVKL